MRRHLTLLISSLFLLSLTYAQQFENGGFEEWEEVGLGADLMEPVNWSSVKTSDNDLISGAAPVLWGVSDDAHSGNHSIHLFNIETFGIVATGTITNGRVHGDFNPELGYVFTDPNDARWHSVFSTRPDSVVGWYKANPAVGDFGTVKIALHTDTLKMPGEEENLVALAYLELSGQAVTTWTRFAVAFEYFKEINPEYYLGVITSGNGTNALPNSEIWFDDLEFIYNPESVEENLSENLLAFSSNGVLNISLKGHNSTYYQLSVCDIMGRQLFEGGITNAKKLNIDLNGSRGVHIITLRSGAHTYSTKVMVN